MVESLKGLTHELHGTSRTYKNIFHSVKLSRDGGERQSCVGRVAAQ